MLKRSADKSYPQTWGLPTGKVQPGEPNKKAMIRELFEETSVLRSSDQIDFHEQFYIDNNDMLFAYCLYSTHFAELPKITLSKEEHTSFAWVRVEEALTMDLIPDLSQCLCIVKERLIYGDGQLELKLQDIWQQPRETIPEDEITKLEYSDWRMPTAEYPVYSTIVFGPPGSGKSTAIKAICKNQEVTYHHESKLILSRGTRLNEYLKKIHYERDHRFSLPFQIEALIMRHQHFQSAREGAIVEQGMISILAYSKALVRLGWMTKAEYQAFFGVYYYLQNSSAKPKKIILMTASTQTLLKRIQARGRRHEADHYSFDYVDEIRRGMYEVSQDIGGDIEFAVVDTSSMNRFTAAEALKMEIG